nr:cbb3-type cytochrome c oxidase subunit I [Acidimicrobiia bacterium]
MTEVATPTATATVPADAASDHVARPGGLAGLLGTGDHVAVGRLFVVASLLFLLVGVVAGALVALEDVDAGNQLFDDAIGQLASIRITVPVFLFLVPAFLGLAISVVPLQLGAGTVAFPRAATASFWAWFLSGGVLLAGYVINGGPTGADLDGQLLWIVGMGGVLVSLTLATVCVLTTLWALRTAGMGLDRTPYFSWSMLVAGSVWLLTLPVLLGLVVLAYIQVRYGNPEAGTAYARLGLAFGIPAAFAWSLPLLGALLDVAGTAGRTRLRFHGALLGAVALFGLLTFPGDMLVAFEDAESPIFQDFLYVVASFVAVLPLLVVAGAVADGLRRGRARVRAPLVLGLAAFLVLLLGAAANAVRVVDNLDLTGTPADAGVTHLAWTAGLLGVVAAVHHWSTKVFGVVLKDGLGYLAGLALLGGGVLTGAAWFVLGFLDADDDAVEVLNIVAFVGWAVLLLGVLAVLVN